jgi:uncharacterized protein (DUF302 family)
MKNYFILIFVLFITVQPNSFASGNYVNKKSIYSVDKTLDRLEKVLKSKGITVFTRIDHGAGANKVGIPMRPTSLLIFGNPKMGTPLMNENIMMALELPMKALAWTDKSGQVWLSYLKPSVLKHRHSVVNPVIFNKMTGALSAMTDAALKE